MFLQLLNEKNDDDDLEARAGIKKQNELLQQLLKEDEGKPSEGQDGSLLSSLGLLLHSPSQGTSGSSTGPATLIGSRKRPSDESDNDFHGPVKRPGSGPNVSGAPEHVSSSGPAVAGGPLSGGSSGGASVNNSRLWEKNKMLASLLAKQPSQPAVIPPVPASIISATPQDKLSRVADRHKQTSNGKYSIIYLKKFSIAAFKISKQK